MTYTAPTDETPKDKIGEETGGQMEPTHPANVAARVRQWGGHPNAWKGDGLVGPMTLEVYPTMACNLDCGFCDTTDRHRPAVQEMPLDRWLEVIDEAAELGVKRLFVLGGGEPMARKSLTLGIMRRAKQHGMEGILTTNGTLFDRKLIETTVQMGWDEVHISIDGPDAATHDPLRGQTGAFRKAVRTACGLSVQRRKCGSSKTRVALHFVITNQNYRCLSSMVELAHSVGAFRIDFDALIAYTPEQRALMLSGEQTRDLLAESEAAESLASQLGIITTLPNIKTAQRMERGTRLPPAGLGDGFKGAPCLKAWHYLVVQSDGRTSPCCVLSGEGGSVVHQSLADVWARDPFLVKVREGMMNKAPLSRCKECSWNILVHEESIRKHI